MKIVVLDSNTVNPGDLSWEELEALGDVTIHAQTPPEKLLTTIGDADAILCTRTKVPGEVFAKKPNLKYVGLFATGYNTIDIEEATKHGVTVCNVPGYSTEAVAQLTFALLLELCHHTAAYSSLARSGGWEEAPSFYGGNMPLLELRGKTMGIIGMGDIGYRVAVIASALGMEVLGYRRHPDPAMEREHIHFASLERVLRESDVISLHCPLFDETRELIRGETIAMMKDGAILLNTSRGPVIHEGDVAQALHSGKLAGVGVDVLSMEPPKSDNPLLLAPNCVVTPHMAWAPGATRARLVSMVAENLRAFLSGKPIHKVN